jgi:putative tricarboxylic transport membrane protein
VSPRKVSQKPAGGTDRTGVVVGAGLLCLSALIVSQTLYATYSPGYERVGPKAFPFGIALGLGLLGLVAVGRALSGRDKHAEHEWLHFAPALWVIGGLLLQIGLLASGAGFILSTAVLFGLVARGFGRRPLALTLLVGVAVCLFLYVAFHFGLKLSLPKGPVERLIS